MAKIKIKMKMKPLEWIVYILMAVGAIHLGIGALFDFNLISWVFNMVSPGIAKWIFVAIGLSGVFSIYKIFK